MHGGVWFRKIILNKMTAMRSKTIFPWLFIVVPQLLIEQFCLHNVHTLDFCMKEFGSISFNKKTAVET